MTQVSTPAGTETTQFDAPAFRRLRYFHGQMLTARDFQLEQEYFREKLKLRVRCLLGYGVVCGLFVEPVPCHDENHPDEPEAAGNDEPEVAGDDEAEAGEPEGG